MARLYKRSIHYQPEDTQAALDYIAANYDLFVVEGFENYADSRLASMRTINPTIKILKYVNALQTLRGSADFENLWENYPSWFMTDVYGDKLYEKDFLTTTYPDQSWNTSHAITSTVAASGTATVTTATKHYYSPGESVAHTGNGVFNGSHTILTTPSMYTYTFASGETATVNGGTANVAETGVTYALRPDLAAVRDHKKTICADWITAGYDGIFLDVVLPRAHTWEYTYWNCPYDHFNSDSTTAGWPDSTPKNPATGNQYLDTAWVTDMAAFVAAIKAHVGAGYIACNGITGGWWYYAENPNQTADDLVNTSNNDSTMFERWCYSWDTNTDGSDLEIQSWWKNGIDALAEITASGVDMELMASLGSAFDALTQAERDTWQEWATASMLLGIDTSADTYLFHDYGDTVNPLFNDIDIGNPSGAYYTAGISYQRDFTGGKVIVNPVDSNNVDPVVDPRYYVAKLDQPYRTVGGDYIEEISLAPKTGAILFIPDVGEYETPVPAMETGFAEATADVASLETLDTAVGATSDVYKWPLTGVESACPITDIADVIDHGSKPFIALDISDAVTDATNYVASDIFSDFGTTNCATWANSSTHAKFGSESFKGVINANEDDTSIYRTKTDGSFTIGAERWGAVWLYGTPEMVGEGYQLSMYEYDNAWANLGRMAGANALLNGTIVAGWQMLKCNGTVQYATTTKIQIYFAIYGSVGTSGQSFWLDGFRLDDKASLFSGGHDTALEAFAAEVQEASDFTYITLVSDKAAAIHLDAHRYIVDLFQKEDATGVYWGFDADNASGSYPENSADVDYQGYVDYQWLTRPNDGAWTSLEGLAETDYESARSVALAASGEYKPVYIETASPEGSSSKSDWLLAARRWAISAGVSGVAWNDDTYPLYSSLGALSGYQYLAALTVAPETSTVAASASTLPAMAPPIFDVRVKKPDGTYWRPADLYDGEYRFELNAGCVSAEISCPSGDTPPKLSMMEIREGLDFEWVGRIEDDPDQSDSGETKLTAVGYASALKDSESMRLFSDTSYERWSSSPPIDVADTLGWDKCELDNNHRLFMRVPNGTTISSALRSGLFYDGGNIDRINQALYGVTFDYSTGASYDATKAKLELHSYSADLSDSYTEWGLAGTGVMSGSATVTLQASKKALAAMLEGKAAFTASDDNCWAKITNIRVNGLSGFTGSYTGRTLLTHANGILPQVAAISTDYSQIATGTNTFDELVFDSPVTALAKLESAIAGDDHHHGFYDLGSDGLPRLTVKAYTRTTVDYLVTRDQLPLRLAGGSVQDVYTSVIVEYKTKKGRSTTVTVTTNLASATPAIQELTDAGISRVGRISVDTTSSATATKAGQRFLSDHGRAQGRGEASGSGLVMSVKWGPNPAHKIRPGDIIRYTDLESPWPASSTTLDGKTTFMVMAVAVKMATGQATLQLDTPGDRLEYMEG